MKQAAGEANITVITIVLIGIVAVAAGLLIPRLLDNIQKKSVCSERAGNMINGNVCEYESLDADGSTVVHQQVLKKCKNGEWAFPDECKK